MAGPFFFAWVDAPIVFDSVTHAVEDEKIIAATIAQEEGDFATLEIDVINPGEGLLSIDRMQWAWFSWFNGSAIIPLFLGRLVAVPEQLDGEAVRLLFRAKPDDYETSKSDLADSLKVLPYFDSVWVTGDVDDTDAVLGTRGARYHIDRVSHNVTISDELVGEDGDITIGEGHALYAHTDMSYTAKPKHKAKFKGTLTWSQTGAGTIDVTEQIYHKFREQKSIYIAPHSGVISTLTGEGLKGDWPTSGTSFGGGWSVNAATTCEDADTAVYAPYTYDVKYEGLAPDWDSTTEGVAKYFLSSLVDYEVKFPVAALKQYTAFDWAADKKRTETLEFTMYADIQPLDADDDDDSTLKITVTATDTVTEPDDYGVMPIEDKRRRAYLPTDRGADSVQYALLLCRAGLRRGARAVECKCRVSWADGVGVSLRKNLALTDRRLPGHTATGKITAYKMVVSATEGLFVDITAGCAIGNGGSVSVTAGSSVYALPGYMDPGYGIVAGATIGVPGLASELVYETLDDFPIDDDGVDLLTLDSTTAVEFITLTGGLADQIDVVTAAFSPIDALKDVPSVICLQLVPVADLSFETVFAITVETLPIPPGVNLEAVA